MNKVKTIIKDTLAAAILLTGTATAQEVNVQNDLIKMQNEMSIMREQLQSIDSIQQHQKDNATTQAQPEQFKPSKTQFMIRGYGTTGINYTEIENESEFSYTPPVFVPLILFKYSDKLLFESELEFGFENGELQTGLEYADINYILNKYITFRAGKFLLPFGTFMERLHPSWINRLSSKPLGFGHDGIAPSTGIGFEIRGAAPIGGGKVNYALYATNGPILKTGKTQPEEAGMLDFENFEDNNKNKAFGGRIGILPFSNSSAEIGFSALSGKVGDAKDPLYEDVGALLYAVDFSFVKQISPLKGIIDIKAQYNQSNVDRVDYFELAPGDTIPTAYSFTNSSNGYYAQLSYRPSMLECNFLKNLDFVGRYSALFTPEESKWEQVATQIAVGLNYWIRWNSVIKFTYQVTESEGGHDSLGVKTTTTGIFLNWALGF